jgi:nicotinic acid mononucleotide adenylyltransferase
MEHPSGFKQNKNAMWPMEKLFENLANVSPDTKKIRLVVQTGALNPVHRGHVAMLEKAKLTLEQQDPNCPVVAGFLSPSHDLYVGPKTSRLGTPFFSSAQRAVMCDLSVEDSTWLSCGRWEMAQEGYWPDFPQVTKNLALTVASAKNASATPSVDLEVFYVCGTDLFYKCRLSRGLRVKTGFENIGVVVVPREGDRVPSEPCPENNVFVANSNSLNGATDSGTSSFSSTKLRNELAASAPIEHLECIAYPGVVAYLTTGLGSGIAGPVYPTQALAQKPAQVPAPPQAQTQAQAHTQAAPPPAPQVPATAQAQESELD